MVATWGAAYQKRTHRRGTTGDECIVCGKHTGEGAAYVTASPATGGFVSAALMGTPEGDRIEASLYPIGPECARAVRRDHPESFPK